MSGKTGSKGVSPKSFVSEHPLMSVKLSRSRLMETELLNMEFATNDATVASHIISDAVREFFGTYTDKKDGIKKSRIGNSVDKAIAVALDKMVQAGVITVEDLAKLHIHFMSTTYVADYTPVSKGVGKTVAMLNGIAFAFVGGTPYLLSSFNMETGRAPTLKFFSVENSNALQLRDSICFDAENIVTISDLYPMAYGWPVSFTLRNISGSNRFCSTIEGAELAKKVIEQCAVDDESMEVALARVTEYLNLCNTHAWTPRRMSDLELLGHVGASEAEADAKASAGQSEDDTPDELKALFAGAMVD